MRPRHQLVTLLAAATLAAAAGMSLRVTSTSRAATAARSCSTVPLNAGRYGGIEAVRVVTVGHVSCPEALHLARLYYGRLAANRCGRLNNFCDLTLPGGWSCSIFFAAESKEAGGAGAGCFRASNGAKVRFYGATTARRAAAPPAHAADASWAIAPTPAPAGHAESLLRSVSCVSARACMAVGTVDDGRSGENRELVNVGAFAESWNGSAWTALPVGAAAGPNAWLNSVSCASSVFCVAVGRTNASGSPSSQYAAPGERALAETWNGTAWAVQPNPASALRGSALNGVTCPSSTFCIAVGVHRVDARGRKPEAALVEVWNGTSWKLQSTPHPGRHGAYLEGVSCAAGSCVTVGGYDANPGTGIDIGHPLAERFDGRRWTVQYPPPAGLYFPELFSVSCVSRSFCLAVGVHELSQQNWASSPFAERWNGTRWTPVRTGLPKYSPLYSVSCITSSYCLAAGQFDPQLVPVQGTTAPLLEEWTGARWSRSATPGGATPVLPGQYIVDQLDPSLMGISCLATIGCTAVGAQAASGTNSSPLAQSEAGAPSATPAATEAPAPVLGRSADVRTVSGAVTVQLPGTSTFVPLTSVSSVPMGTMVDATNGTVQLTSATDRRGHTQTGSFYSGAFRLTQRRARSQTRSGRKVEVTVLTLTGGTPTECSAAGARATMARRRRLAKLWGNSRRGNFATQNGDVSAGSRDPQWLTEETCSGTLVKVVQGVVAVENLHTHRTVLVRAGHSTLVSGSAR